jgi:ferric-dicitrate binding protein FerR (iron transport regulator)
MKKILTIAAIALLTVGCAGLAPIAGMETTQQVRYTCEGGDFSARLSEDYTSARLRTKEGSVDLDRREGNEFVGEGWTLKTNGGMQLMHKEKVVAKNCRKDT